VRNQLVVHASASLALFQRLLVNVDAPFALFQSGDRPHAVGLTYPSPSTAAFGDVRFGLRLRLLGDYDSPVQLAVGGNGCAPTGTGDFMTDGAVRGMPQVILGGQHDAFVYSVAVGTEIRPTKSYFNTVAQGPSFLVNGGFGLRLGPRREVQVGPEFAVNTVL